MTADKARHLALLPILVLALTSFAAPVGDPPPFRSQIEVMKASAAAGDVQAKQVLDQVMKKVPEFLSMLEAEAGKGQAMAKALLGVLHEQGLFLRQDDEKALALYREAMAKADPTGSMLACRCIALGKGTAKDEPTSLRCFNRAVNAELAKAANAPILWAGGVPNLIKAAETGNALAITHLGWLYLTGNGVPRDDREAARLLGIADRQWSGGGGALGILYEEGRGGLPKDPSEAMRLYLKAGDDAFRGAIETIDHMLLTLAMTS